MDIYIEENTALSPEQTEMIKNVVKWALGHCDVCSDIDLGISFVDTAEIKKLNLEYRGKDTATDVLSFPVSDELMTVEGEPQPLGDIVICIDVAKAQAADYGHSFDRELAFLVVHGVLHLLGYNHETSDEEAEMIATQRCILDNLGISR